MGNQSLRIDLSKLAGTAGSLAASMRNELEGRPKAAAASPSWPARFISAATKRAEYRR
jgi:hypothetical protein